MTFQQYSTYLKPVYKKPQNLTTLLPTTNPSITLLTTTLFDGSNSEPNMTSQQLEVDYYAKTGVYGGGINVLGLVMFCFIFGAVIAKMGEAGEILVKFFEALNEASIRMINLVMM
jgi:Na+/H+-dicarboxylate symporter